MNTVEINGVDVSDPTTGQIRNSSTDDTACWFIDTDYNGESFFVRHAYFTAALNRKPWTHLLMVDPPRCLGHSIPNSRLAPSADRLAPLRYSSRARSMTA
jgi:hypothetical protein